ncbi:hypothetical protein [Ottowia sp.]|uniref:hypothetical protein n=1 Tax=Ottowia sp. TaxID=1898956 RepID=UPI001D890AE8|nr:hypothetical protein [Ottowia sp.]MCB2024591.1 hypothetical protein [Ottowia sp.]MCB2034650.1 hypothetical protein [Ottowia sp.]HPR45331.1 hypothetical protein [Ottowia sp.]HRW71696.1 hypothetical protein [Ottowia sp.]
MADPAAAASAAASAAAATSAASLWWGVLFGAVGAGYIVYGRRQRAALPFLCGAGLLVLPYLIANIWLMVGLSAVLLALPWAIGR